MYRNVCRYLRREAANAGNHLENLVIPGHVGIYCRFAEQNALNPVPESAYSRHHRRNLCAVAEWRASSRRAYKIKSLCMALPQALGKARSRCALRRRGKVIGKCLKIAFGKLQPVNFDAVYVLTRSTRPARFAARASSRAWALASWAAL